VDVTKMIINDMFTYNKLKPYIGLKGAIKTPHPETLIGIEIELELVTYKSIPATFAVTEDHSLKLQGCEFVSIPLEIRYAEIELTRLFKSFITPPSPSNRCSIHVHLNVRDLTVDELNSLLAFYIIYEKTLFKLSGNRWKSNYCTPISNNPDMIITQLKYPFDQWLKYSALNLCPIFGGESKKFGTIEFRHMKGTTSVEEILQWCNIISCFKYAAKKFNINTVIKLLETLNTSSEYWGLTRDIFGELAELMINLPNFKEDVESGVSKAKFCFLNKSVLEHMKGIKNHPKPNKGPDGLYADDLLNALAPPPKQHKTPTQLHNEAIDNYLKKAAATGANTTPKKTTGELAAEYLEAQTFWANKAQHYTKTVPTLKPKKPELKPEKNTFDDIPNF